MAPRFVDTQVLVHAFNGQSPVDLRYAHISSVAASEFLRVYDDTVTQARYYVPLMGGYVIAGEVEQPLMPRRTHPFGKLATDQVLLSYGRPFPAVIEFGSLAISGTINNRLGLVFAAATDFLPKAERKLLRARHRFLLDHGITCVPLSRGVCALAGELLHAFAAKHQLKANFRNSLNDILILATAQAADATLVTQDGLLARFAGSTRVLSSPFVEVSFSSPGRTRSIAGTESKGFVNVGWQITFRRWGNRPG